MREPEDGAYSYEVHQGQAMGCPSRIATHATRGAGLVTRIAVSGHAHHIEHEDHGTS
jgi:predicted PhzF superfamily epimerase YddE/YHI9